MSDDRVESRLVAILYADVAGYSRLTGRDEIGTHRQLRTGLDLFTNQIQQHGGRVVHYAGDAVLAEFASVIAALETAICVQRQMEANQLDEPDAARLKFRVGLNLGEVIVDQDEIYGDGVNIAARLESLADPGGVCVSETVYEQAQGKVDVAFEAMGLKSVKNIAHPIAVYRVVDTPQNVVAPAADNRQALTQTIRYCSAKDGATLAYSTVGEGPPLVKTANWLNHLEFDWESPIWRHVVFELARDHCLIRYDQRGVGLSDWNVEHISFDAWVSDFEVLVDTLALERFPIFAVSQGCSVAVAYAARHPDRVSRLVLYGGYLRGRNHRGSETVIAQEEAMLTLIKNGWGQENPAFRQVFTSLFVPDATAEQMQWYNDLQRVTASTEKALMQRKVQNDIDVTDIAAAVSAPTLVLHAKDDANVPFTEGQLMASLIPGARFVPLEGRNHLILENEPAWPMLLKETRDFLSADNG